MNLEKQKLTVPVEEFTTPNPVTASENAAIEDMSAMMKANGIRHLPVMRAGRVVGIVSDRDLKVVMGLNTGERNMVRAGDIMVQNPVTVNASASLRDVAFEMSKSKIGSVIVNDENDEFLGIFTATDALNALIEILEVRDGSN